MTDAGLEKAKNLASAGHYKEAMALLKNLLQANPEDKQARELLTDLQDRMMLDLQIRDRLAKAKDLLAKGEKDSATKLAQDILKVSPGHPEALALLEQPAAKPAPPPPVPSPPKAPSPEETVAMDGFELKELSSLPETLPEASEAPLDDLEPSLGTGDEAEPLMSLDSLDAFEMPEGEPVTERTSLSGTASQLGPGEKKKIAEYLQEGQKLFDSNRFQDAVDVWTRVFILDENNQDAEALITKARERMNAHQGEIEHNLTEGIAAYNAGDLARSKPLLEKVLQSFPGHREAQYYLNRMGETKAVHEAVTPTEPTEPILSEQGPEEAAAPESSFGGSGDEFELEDNLNVPTGPEMRAGGPPAPVSFQWETEPEMPPTEPPPPASAPPTAPPAPAGSPGEEPQSFVWDDVAPAAGTPPVAHEEPAPAGTVFPPAPGMEAQPLESEPEAGPVRAGGAKASRGFPRGLIIGAIVGLFVVAFGIFLGARWLFGVGEPAPVATTTPIPRPTHPKPPPAQPETPPPVVEENDPHTMPMDDVMKTAKEALAARDYEKAIRFYQEALNRDAANPAVLEGLSAARSALQKQRLENERNEKFIKDYKYSIQSFQEQDYAECLRVAWRLIYPDDTLAKQLGKRDNVARLIRDGYYNWAVMDLKMDNVRGADKNLKDLLDFDRTDREASKLQQVTRKYLNQSLDENYKDVVKSLDYRPFQETP
jgi:tetratricopeptide (TPR) repeat protein